MVFYIKVNAKKINITLYNTNLNSVTKNEQVLSSRHNI